jgi:hypothetical protein
VNQLSATIRRLDALETVLKHRQLNPFYIPTVHDESTLATFETIFGRITWEPTETDNNAAGLETVEFMKRKKPILPRLVRYMLIICYLSRTNILTSKWPPIWGHIH